MHKHDLKNNRLGQSGTIRHDDLPLARMTVDHGDGPTTRQARARRRRSRLESAEVWMRCQSPKARFNSHDQSVNHGGSRSGRGGRGARQVLMGFQNLQRPSQGTSPSTAGCKCLQRRNQPRDKPPCFVTAVCIQQNLHPALGLRSAPGLRSVPGCTPGSAPSCRAPKHHHTPLPARRSPARTLPASSNFAALGRSASQQSADCTLRVQNQTDRIFVSSFLS